MTITRRIAALGGLGLAAAAGFNSNAKAEGGLFADLTEGTDEFAVAIEAYIYGYPLVTMEMTRRVITNVAEARGHARPDGPVHQACANIRRGLPRCHRAERRHALHDRLPRCRQGAVGGQPPGHEGPLFPVADARRLDQRCSSVPGKRTTGTGAQTYAITGPGWKGDLPEGVKEYKSPTSMVWILGRIYCTGTPEDYKEVHELQDAVSSSFRSAPTARTTRRRPARSIRRST